jgi:hypothetical protein
MGMTNWIFRVLWHYRPVLYTSIYIHRRFTASRLLSHGPLLNQVNDIGLDLLRGNLNLPLGS